MQKTVTIQIPIEFKRLFDDDWREAAIYGGRFSLKSHTVARYLLIRARQKKTRVACFREFQNSIAESSHQLLRELIGQYGLTDFEVTNNAIVNKLNGSDFLFKGLYHNEQNVKSTEGIDIAWVEEAQTISQNSLEVLTPTVRKAGSKIVYTYNRLLEDDPVHNRLVIEGRPDTLIINVNYDVALKYGFIPEVILKEIRDDEEKRPTLYKHKWLGEPYSLERRIFKDWLMIDEIPHEARLEGYGMDFGYKPDPTAIIAVYYFNGGYILDEVFYQIEASNAEIADTLKNFDRALVIADSAEKDRIADIRSYGLNILPARKGPGSVRAGLKMMQDLKISVTKQSKNLIHEYTRLLWKVDENGKILAGIPEEGNDHGIDAARYRLELLIPIHNRRDAIQRHALRNQQKPKTNIAL